MKEDIRRRFRRYHEATDGWPAPPTMLIPYATDAPVYHWPYATVGLIAANVVALYGAHVGPLGPVDAWMLSYGDGVHPGQWVSSMFMHGDFMHLIGNMVFL